MGRDFFVSEKIRTKPDLEYIKKEFEKEGYVLMAEEYVNSKTKLLCTCDKGHKYDITWNSWQQGRRCLFCYGRNRKDIDFVKESFEKEGYTVLSKEYINSSAKLNYICPNGHKHSICWRHWRSGKRCPVCSGVAKPALEQIKESFAKEGYTLLSNNYVNNKTKLEFICPSRHIGTITWHSWCSGSRCLKCKYRNVSLGQMGPKNHQWKGGLSYEPYCPIWKDREYKQDIKERDGYKCLNPDCWRRDDRLHIHHIDYNKKNCFPNNLITVCRSCNAKANKDREWHTAWYQAIIKNRYNREG